MVKEVSEVACSVITDRQHKIIYATPETSKENGHAEKAISMAEQTIKAILMQNNLEPSWWEVASRDAQFLLNRLPNIACVRATLRHR